MPENEGLYQKYRVERLDGKPIIGPVFVLDLGSDSTHAAMALSAYADSCETTLPALASSLWALAREMEDGQTDGPMHQALRTPRDAR